MPLPDENVKGFGYVTGRAVDAGEESEASLDSRLSSTSLYHTLIEPSSSEDWLWLEEEADDKRIERWKTVRQMSFFKRASALAAKEAGLQLDYKEVRGKDKLRDFQSQVVPVLPPGQSIKRPRSSYSKVGLSMPLMQQLGMAEKESDEEETRQSKYTGRRKIDGLVGDIMRFLEKRPASPSTYKAGKVRERAQREESKDQKDSITRTRRKLTLLSSDVDPETFFTQEIFSYDEYHALSETADINVVYDKRINNLTFDDISDKSSDSEDIISLVSADSINILKMPSLMLSKRRSRMPMAAKLVTSSQDSEKDPP